MQLSRENIILKTSVTDELEQLNCIFNEACEYFNFDEKREFNPPHQNIMNGDPPPNKEKVNYTFERS